MRVINNRGSEPCQILSNVSIIAYSTLVSDRMMSLNLISGDQWWLQDAAVQTSAGCYLRVDMAAP